MSALIAQARQLREAARRAYQRAEGAEATFAAQLVLLIGDALDELERPEQAASAPVPPAVDLELAALVERHRRRRERQQPQIIVRNRPVDASTGLTPVPWPPA
ncbi:MAG: hypothetical protein KC503_36825 [Myxococcales bacterium]|nr:hypothetical protein [Myxococcales bacterium]